MPTTEPSSQQQVNFDFLWSEYAAQVDQIKNYNEQSLEIFPQPGFVMKCFQYEPVESKTPISSKERPTRKVFINMCSEPSIQPPETQPVRAEDGTMQEQLRIPLSCGQPRLETDKEGVECIVYDVVFSPDTIQKCMPKPHQADVDAETADFRSFVSSFARDNIVKKFQVEFKQEMKFPRLRYKGTLPVPSHRIRKPPSKDGAPPSSSSSSSSPNIHITKPSSTPTSTHKGPLIEELREEEPPKKSPPTPSIVSKSTPTATPNTTSTSTSAPKPSSTSATSKPTTASASAPTTFNATAPSTATSTATTTTTTTTPTAAPPSTTSSATITPAPSSTPSVDYIIPTYIMSYRDKSDAIITPSPNDTDLPALLIIDIDLPDVFRSSEISAEVSSHDLVLTSLSSSPHHYHLQIQLDYIVNDAQSTAKFDKKSKHLIIKVPILNKFQEQEQPLAATTSTSSISTSTAASPPPDWRTRYPLKNPFINQLLL